MERPRVRQRLATWGVAFHTGPTVRLHGEADAAFWDTWIHLMHSAGQGWKMFSTDETLIVCRHSVGNCRGRVTYKERKTTQRASSPTLQHGAEGSTASGYFQAL